MIYLSIYTIEEYLERHCISAAELARRVDLDPRNMDARKKSKNHIAELCGGHAVMLPKRVADDLRRKSGHYGV